MLLVLRTMRRSSCFQQKGAGINERSVPAKEDPEKRTGFPKFGHKLPEAERRDVLKYSMEACESYKAIEKFDKVFS